MTGALPLPGRRRPSAGGAGIDLNPLDVTDDDAMAWLATLVWPEQDDRRDRLRTAVAVARTDPPRLCARRPARRAARPGRARRRRTAPVVVFHSAVIAYLEPADRRRFHELMTGLVGDGRCHWVSNEGPRVLPEVTATGPERPEAARDFRARRRRPGGRPGPTGTAPLDALVRLSSVSGSAASTSALWRWPTIS